MKREKKGDTGLQTPNLGREESATIDDKLPHLENNKLVVICGDSGLSMMSGGGHMVIKQFVSKQMSPMSFNGGESNDTQTRPGFVPKKPLEKSRFKGFKEKMIKVKFNVFQNQQARPSILSHLADGSNRVNFSEGLHFHESQSQLKVKAKSVQRSPHSQLRKMVLPVIQKNETEFKKLLPPH